MVVELTVLELLAELLSGLVISVLLVTVFLVPGIFSVSMFFAGGLRQAITIISLLFSLKLRLLFNLSKCISEFASGFVL